MKKNNTATREIEEMLDREMDEMFTASINTKSLSKADLKIVKDERKQLSTIFQQLANNDEVHRLGKQFLTDYDKGDKHFAFSSVEWRDGQRKTLLSIASYFHLIKDLRIGIFTEDLNDGVFKEILSAHSQASVTGFASPCGSVTVYKFPDNFDFISIDPEKKLTASIINTHEYKQLVDGIIEQYNMIFWDVPSLSEIKKNIQLYFPLITSTSSLTLVIGEEQATTNKINELINFFDNYGVPAKGVVIDKKAPKGKLSKKLHELNWVKRLLIELEED